MADLKSMFAKPSPKENRDGVQAADDARPAVEGPGTDAVGDGRIASDPAAEPASRPVPSGESPSSGNPFARKAASTQPPAVKIEPLPEAQAAGSGSVVPESEPSRPRLAGFKFAGAGTKPAPVAPVQPVRKTVETLDDLDNIDLSDLDAEVTQVERRSQFPDETPATAPTRELPEGLDRSSLQFIDLIDGVYSIIHDPELLGNVVKSIMIELKANPQYMKLVAPDDVRTWIRGMRDSMGLARVKKTESKAKRGTGKAAGKAIDNDMLNDLADLGIDL